MRGIQLLLGGWQLDVNILALRFLQLFMSNTFGLKCGLICRELAIINVFESTTNSVVNIFDATIQVMLLPYCSVALLLLQQSFTAIKPYITSNCMQALTPTH